MHRLKFHETCAGARDQGWEPTYVGYTWVLPENAAVGGLRLAILQQRQGRDARTRIVAADINPESNALSDTVVQHAELVASKGVISFTDALPVEALSGFSGSAFPALVDDHARYVHHLKGTQGQGLERTDEELLAMDVSPNALAVVDPADNSGTMQVLSADGHVVFHVSRDPLAL